jgi:hypothetical protein
VPPEWNDVESEIQMTKTIKLVAALLTAILAVGAYTASIAPAGAADAGNDAGVAGKTAIKTTAASQTFKNQSTRECLDNLNGRLWTYKCDGTSEQKWTVTHWADGTVRLKNVKNGECLSDSGGTLGTSSTCTTSKYQSFYVTHWADGTIRFKNQGSGQCVKAASGHDVGSSTRCDSSKAESWY